ncbi:MAG TPA: phosphoribosyltransferase family protein [Acidimicrobiia bacterium]
MSFRDRSEAGRRLAEKLTHLRDEHPVVVGLPRGGVPVAYEVARELAAPLDVIVVRKLGVPFQPELGFGAVGEGGVRVINDDVVRMAGVTADEQARVEERERAEVERRARRFRGDREAVPLSGRTVIVVDDGLATGGTARAALRVARAHGAGRVVLAVPVAPPDTLESMRPDADEVVCLESPTPFFAIGQWYADFTQTSDEEVIELLAEPPGTAAVTGGAPGAAARGAALDEEVEIPADMVEALSGHLTIPADAIGLVVFAHGSGSSRFSPRNRAVAQALHQAGLGTLLFDLLTEHEAMSRANVFDIELLADRLAAATEWLREEPAGHHPVGYFGASTGAAAALWAAAEPAAPVRAVVSRGGRPDLAGPRLAAVRAPTLLIVGGHDEVVLDLNREAERMLGGERRLEVVPGATHLFEEPGALEAVAGLARDWFVRHLGAASP